MGRWFTRSLAAIGALFLLFVVVWIACLLGGNPGYFSHDELQWGAYAVQARPPVAADWLAIGQFQYRPLTFQLWLQLSRQLFDTPRLYHIVWLLLGALNAALLYAALRGLLLSATVAAVAALLFWLNPYAVFVHGWVGTLGDLLWVMATLCIMLTVQRADRPGMHAPRLIAVAALTLVALLAKEAALSIPCLLFVAWLLSRKRGWRDAFLASAVVAGVYLLLRVGVLTAHSHLGSGYGIDLAGAPLRFLHYQVFPWFIGAEEINAIPLFSEARQWNLAILTLLLWLAVLRGYRDWLAWLLLSLAALGPALLIAATSNQYGYGLGAVLIGLAAWYWRNLGAIRRGVLLCAALILCWHSVGVARHMREVGEIQAVYSPSLASALAEAGLHGNQPMGLRADCDGQRWIYQRLSHGIPQYDGVAIGSRVRVLAPGDASLPGERRIACNGRVYSPD